MGSSPSRVVSGGSVGGGVEEPSGGAADGVVGVDGCGGSEGDEEGEDGEVGRDRGRRHGAREVQSRRVRRGWGYVDPEMSTSRLEEWTNGVLVF